MNVYGPTADTSTPSSAACSKTVRRACHCSGAGSSRQTTWLRVRSSPGTAVTKPRIPWLPGGRPVPSVARLTGVVLGQGAERSPTGPVMRGEGRREVGVRADQVGPEPVDEQDGDPPGPAECLGQTERVGGQPVPLDPHAEGGGHAGQDVGEGLRAVGRAVQVRRQVSPPGGQDVQAGGDVAERRGVGERQLQGTDRLRVGPRGRVQQVGDDGDATPRAGLEPGPSTRASSAAGSKRRRAGRSRPGVGSWSSSRARASRGGRSVPARGPRRRGWPSRC